MELDNVNEQILRIEAEKEALVAQRLVSNRDIKDRIIKARHELDTFEQLLFADETPVRKELKRLDTECVFAQEKRLILMNVIKLKRAVHGCTDVSKLPNIFTGNRYCTYYYSNKTCGYYSDRVNAPVPTKDHVEFDNGAAYDIAASSSLSHEEKVKKLDELFDVFLGK